MFLIKSYSMPSRGQQSNGPGRESFILSSRSAFEPKGAKLSLPFEDFMTGCSSFSLLRVSCGGKRYSSFFFALKRVALLRKEWLVDRLQLFLEKSDCAYSQAPGPTIASLIYSSSLSSSSECFTPFERNKLLSPADIFGDLRQFIDSSNTFFSPRDLTALERSYSISTDFLPSSSVSAAVLTDCFVGESAASCDVTRWTVLNFMSFPLYF